MENFEIRYYDEKIIEIESSKNKERLMEEFLEISIIRASLTKYFVDEKKNFILQLAPA
jgi:hypothetical protein